jgi:hypothetical protein
MNTRPLSPVESRNLAQLNQSGHSSVLLFVTETGLRKSILDATEPMRRLFRESGFHDYSSQSQGATNKVRKRAVILGANANEQTDVSLYRPTTKSGDPRLWFSRFQRFAAPNDACAVFVHDGLAYVLNLTRSSLAHDVAKNLSNPCTNFLNSLASASNSVADELLERLRDIANAGPLKAVCGGDTAIGRSVEHALGIKINSSKKPDYNGIELKSSRSYKVRNPLFGCVPNWKLSTLKSSLEILDRFGYIDNKGIFAFRCTVSSNQFNPNGLILQLDEAANLLRELYKASPHEEICVWDLTHLHSRLIEKHNETFWIKADSTMIKGVEHFLIRSALHTSKPSCEQFDRLLSDGSITVDHMSEEVRTVRKGQVRRSCYEKGPVFKVKPARKKELFLGAPKLHSIP